MEKKMLGEKIKLARKYCTGKTGIKMTQQLLAEAIGVSRSYLGDIESGRTYPTLVVLKSIAEACSLTLDKLTSADEWLEQDDPDQTASDGEQEELKIRKKTGFSAIPVLGIIRAGEPILASENILGYEYLPEELSNSGSYFGLKVIGDSMTNSRIFEGDTILVRRQEEVENGEIAVVLVNSEDATVKRFYRSGNMITLMPDSSNREHQPKFFDVLKNEVSVLGKVVKVIINI